MVPVTKPLKHVPGGSVLSTVSARRPRALVTGAAGGLGREVAAQLAARGCDVGIVDINAAGLRETAAQIDGAGRAVLEIACDLTREGEPEAAVGRVVDAWGGIDALVNNAGYGAIEPFLDSSYRTWTRTLALNVTALAMACKAAGRVMREQRSGRIVNITSPGSRMALPDYTAYTASKAGVDFDHPGAGGGAGALRRAGEQPGAGDDGHRDAALDRGGSRRGRPGGRICRPSSTSGRGGCRSDAGPRLPRSRRPSSGSRSTLPPT